MKKIVILFFCALLSLTEAHAEASKFDILINANNFKFSPDLRQIVFYDPTLNLKNEKENTALQRLSANDFVNLWNPTSKDKKSFATSNPNAILTCWNKEKNYLEASFIIQNTSLQGNKLVLDVKYLEGEKPQKSANALPLTINAKPAHRKNLQDFFTSSGQEASVTVIVDNPWNPHGGKH